jgi:hypothetical protein
LKCACAGGRAFLLHAEDRVNLDHKPSTSLLECSLPCQPIIVQYRISRLMPSFGAHRLAACKVYRTDSEQIELPVGTECHAVQCAVGYVLDGLAGHRKLLTLSSASTGSIIGAASQPAYPADYTSLVAVLGLLANTRRCHFDFTCTGMFTDNSHQTYTPPAPQYLPQYSSQSQSDRFYIRRVAQTHCTPTDQTPNGPKLSGPAGAVTSHAGTLPSARGKHP